MAAWTGEVHEMRRNGHARDKISTKWKVFKHQWIFTAKQCCV